MSRPLRVHAYGVLGNTFAIVDETRGRRVPEAAKGPLARLLADPAGGPGCDDVLFVQRPDGPLLEELRRARPYPWLAGAAGWPAGPAGAALRVLRVFEPDGSEAAMCGNGALAVGAFLADHAGLERAALLTEIPTRRPRVRAVLPAPGTPGLRRVLMGPTGAIPPQFLAPACPRAAVAGGVERLPPLAALLGGGTGPGGDAREVAGRLDPHWRAYLAYSGEPHLILLPRRPEPAGGPASLFPEGGDAGDDPLLQRLGDAINRRRDLFPEGINVCPMRPVAGRGWEMRYYERGLFRETGACGTGTVAGCAVALALGLLDRPAAVAVVPHRARAAGEAGAYAVERGPCGWSLTGPPRRLAPARCVPW